MGKKKKLVTPELEDIDFAEVKTVRDDTEANTLLSSGWLLLNAGVSHIDSSGYQAKPHFILGRKRK